MTTRMNADDRRELVLEAATRAFARGGYAGTSTDAVAKEAGVSQPYVVRIFGTKLQLFLEVLDRSVGRIDETFGAVLDERPFDPASEEDRERLGRPYTALLSDQNMLQVMMHGYAAGNIPEIGAASRAGMGRVFETVRRTGWTDDECRNFIAHGMLLNVLLSMRAPEHLQDDEALAALTKCAYGEALEQLA